jgi:hypothetical protein
MAMHCEWEEEEIHVDAPDFGNYSTVYIGDAMTETKRSFWNACCSHEARRKTARLSLFYLRYLYFFAFTVVISTHRADIASTYNRMITGWR